MKLTGLIPMLNVSDIEASLDFYRKALSFEVVSQPEAVKEWRWCTLRADSAELMLSETSTDLGLEKNIDPHRSTRWPTIFYFCPDDVETLYKRVTKSGFRATPLVVTFYAMKEFSLQDPDGHLLTFGEETNEASGPKDTS